MSHPCDGHRCDGCWKCQLGVCCRQPNAEALALGLISRAKGLSVSVDNVVADASEHVGRLDLIASDAQGGVVSLVAIDAAKSRPAIRRNDGGLLPKSEPAVPELPVRSHRVSGSQPDFSQARKDRR